MKTLLAFVLIVLSSAVMGQDADAQCCYMAVIPNSHISQFNSLMSKHKGKVQQRQPVGKVVVVWYCCSKPIKTEGCIGVDFRFVESKDSQSRYQPRSNDRVR